MNLFNLFAKISLDSSGMENGLNDSKLAAKRWYFDWGQLMKLAAQAVTAVTGAIAAAAGAVAKFATSTTSHLNEIDDAAKQLQITTTQYQEWDWIMKQIGGDSTTLEQAFRQIATVTSNLADGNVDAMVTMRKLGIEYKDFMNLDASKQLDTLIAAFQELEEGTDKTALAQEVFGNRVYQKLMPILNDAKGSVEDMKEEINELGLVMGEDVVEQGQKLADKLTYMKGTVKQLTYNLGAELMPALELFVDGITEIATGQDIDAAFQKIFDGVDAIVDKVVTLLPKLIDIGVQILVKLIEGIVSKIPDIMPSIITLVENLIYTLLDILPDLIGSAGEIISALIEGLLQLDWIGLVVKILETILEIAMVKLPEIVFRLVDTIFNLFTGTQSLKRLGQIGLKIAEVIVNGIIMGFETSINMIINAINLLLKGISTLWTWLGIPAIPSIPNVSIPRVSFMAQGGMFEDLMNGYGTAYAITGESGAEIVASGSKGTGVTNVEQFSEAMFDALRRFFGNSATFRIGDRDFKAYINQSQNSTLKSQGRRTLNNVTRY